MVDGSGSSQAVRWRGPPAAADWVDPHRVRAACRPALAGSGV